MSNYWPEFLLVALAHLVAVASPGPDFAMVLRQSITFGRRPAIWTSIGIGTGTGTRPANWFRVDHSVVAPRETSTRSGISSSAISSSWAAWLSVSLSARDDNDRNGQRRDAEHQDHHHVEPSDTRGGSQLRADPTAMPRLV